MPLSEHEQRLLDQIEQALYAEDPKWANTVRISDPRSHYKRRLIKASIGFALGVVLLMVGVVINMIPARRRRFRGHARRVSVGSVQLETHERVR